MPHDRFMVAVMCSDKGIRCLEKYRGYLEFHG